MQQVTPSKNKNDDVFMEIRQTINFLKLPDFQDYLNPTIKNKYFSTLRNDDVLRLLER